MLDKQRAVGLPATILAATGFASGKAVADLETHGVNPLVAIGHTQRHRPCDLQPPPDPKPAWQVKEP